MRKNFNTAPNRAFSARRSPDGVLCELAIDQFPGANPAYKKANGFRASDISVLERFSTTNHDQSEIDLVAARIQEIRKSPQNHLTDDELLRTLKPAWVQTASEVKYYEEQVFQYVEEKKAKAELLKDTEVTSTSVAASNGSETPSQTAEV